MRRLRVFRPGTVPYDTALAAQMACVERLKSAPPAAGGDGFLLLLTHPPVITVGRSGDGRNILVSRERLRQEGVEVRQVSRGGDVTYHGSGQIVGYPIIRLAEHGRDVHAYLRRLEQVIMDTLADYRITAQRSAGHTGVWVGREKVAAIGVAITRWISYHGFALNVAPNFRHFGLINACGITDRQVTSMSRLLGAAVDQAQVEVRLARHFGEEFGFNEIEESAVLPSAAAIAPAYG